MAARVTLTVTGARAIVYSVIRCPNCGRRMVDVPGEPLVSLRTVLPGRASGRGCVIRCDECKNDVEVIVHG
jgi:ribosomal protein S27E